MIVRLWCRLVGHKWVLVPGVSHGHDELFECRRCGACDWRDAPVQEGTVLSMAQHADGPAAGDAANDEVRERRAASGRPARVSRR